ncbi:ABC transporter permease [Pontimicrobium sp. IMCC45349]|uniref:ABC transporter permease n=1 Tax=Pontimicrobium sp. IMCC45349 TaxID=3391574 RepID=UPI0039A0130B
MSLETRVYQKENNKSIFKHAKESFQDIGNSLYLAKQLAVRDIKSQYRQSFLGIFWALITPLATALVWVVLNLSGTVALSETGIPYPIFAFSGTLLWSILTESINSPINNTNAAKGILSKINFPKEALVVSGIYKLLFNSSVKIILLFVFLFLFKVDLSWSLIWFPFVLIAIILFGTTIGLLLTPIGLLYKDISKIIPISMSFLMYATPVVYIIPKEGFMKALMEYNPLTALILTARDVLVGTPPTFLNNFLIITAIALPLFMVALVLYRISIPILVERISS